MKRVAAALLVLVVTASVAPAAVAEGVAPAAVGSTDGATTAAPTVGQSAANATARSAANATAQASVGTTRTSVTATQAAGNGSVRAYSGTYVSFDADARAVTDYAVGGETMLQSVKVESKRSVARGGLVDLGAGLSAVTDIEGAGLGVTATTRTEATVAAESGATLTAHDNPRGLVVIAGSNRSNQSNYVVADLPAGTNATADGDSQVEVAAENGTEGTFIVVGAGNATVNDEGDVSARLGDGGLLVFRAYPDGKDDRDEKQEELIAEGTARAEAYVMVQNGSEATPSGTNASETNASETNAGGTNASNGANTTDGANATDVDESATNTNESARIVVDTVSYGANTTIETAGTAAGSVSFAVSRTTDEGTILLTGVSERALAVEDLEVTVDGEAAAEARTYTQLKSAVGSDRSRYVVERAGGGESASADANADVLVAVNRFSERTVSIASESASEESSADGATGGDGESGDATGDDPTTDDGEDASEATATTTVADDGTGTGTGVPGFTLSAALLGLVGALLLARRR